MPSLARSRCSLAREGRFSSLDVRIGSSPSSGFLKLLPWEGDSGGLGGLGTHRSASDARGGGGGALGDLGVGYTGNSQRCMRRVKRSAACVRSCGIDVLRVECVREVSGRVWGSIWGAGAP